MDTRILERTYSVYGCPKCGWRTTREVIDQSAFDFDCPNCGEAKFSAFTEALSPLRDVTAELTPEQKLGSLIIQDFEGSPRFFVPAWVWESHKKINWDDVQPFFDEYIKAKSKQAQ